ncbi:hypothetical protein CGCSCA1_v002903 [Colletotrichum siamense]|nr:hypothetical protein CGCSCA1_v002903 [Colletotrichum siamense]
MTELTSIRAFLLLPRSSNITTQFTLETPYGLIVELKSGEKLNVRLKDNPSTSAAKAQDAPDSAPEILPDAQPKDSHESLSELNLNSDTASDQDHSHMGLAYSISTDYGTSGLWYKAGWPGNGSEYDFHIYLEELEDRYPAAWLQAFAR